MINKKKCKHEIEISERYSKKLKNISMVMLRVINKESNKSELLFSLFIEIQLQIAGFQ